MSIDRNLYRTGRHVVYDLQAHIVLITKYRRGAITDRVHEVIATTADYVCTRLGCTLLEINGEDDHVHLIVSYPPKIALSNLVMSLKTNTAREVRKKNWDEVTTTIHGNHFWSPSYFVSSTGGASLDKVITYVQNQRGPSRGVGNPNFTNNQTS